MDRVLIRIRNHEIPPPPPEADLAEYLLNGGKVPETPKPSRAPVTLKELADQYETAHKNGAMEANSLATARMHLNHFLDFLGQRFVAQSLSSQDLQGYLDKRARRKGAKGKRMSPTTLRKEVASLRAAWNWATRTGLLRGNFPGRGLTYPKTDEKEPFQTREEIERKIARGGLDEKVVAELWDCLFLTKAELTDFLTYARARPFIRADCEDDQPSRLPFLGQPLQLRQQAGSTRRSLEADQHKVATRLNRRVPPPVGTSQIQCRGRWRRVYRYEARRAQKPKLFGG